MILRRAVWPRTGTVCALVVHQRYYSAACGTHVIFFKTRFHAAAGRPAPCMPSRSAVLDCMKVHAAKGNSQPPDAVPHYQPIPLAAALFDVKVDAAVGDRQPPDAPDWLCPRPASLLSGIVHVKTDAAATAWIHSVPHANRCSDSCALSRPRQHRGRCCSGQTPGAGCPKSGSAAGRLPPR